MIFFTFIRFYFHIDTQLHFCVESLLSYQSLTTNCSQFILNTIHNSNTTLCDGKFPNTLIFSYNLRAYLVDKSDELATSVRYRCVPYGIFFFINYTEKYLRKCQMTFSKPLEDWLVPWTLYFVNWTRYIYIMCTSSSSQKVQICTP